MSMNSTFVQHKRIMDCVSPEYEEAWVEQIVGHSYDTKPFNLGIMAFVISHTLNLH